MSLLLLIAACSGRCPDGTSPDDARAAAILDLSGAPDAPICFGARDHSVITADGVLLLDASMDDPSAAARVLHLLAHRGPAPPPGPGCVEASLTQEAEAWALELRARARMGLPADRYPFELSFRQSDDIGLIARWLREHPDGAGHVDAVGAGIARRCGPQTTGSRR
ncbi:MAG: hypothetical protein H6739_37645 [Alphaproteobacteria bacterium]|nr:hypothetical protein [Alphaproteobacteria bacterium]